MNKELTILIIEDDEYIRKNFLRIADSNPFIKIIGLTNNSTEGYKLTKDYIPDAVILDLELHAGSGNGLEYLKNIMKDNTIIKPYILVTTNNSSSITYNFARDHGADFIMSKHEANYSETHVIEFLIMLSDTIKAAKNITKPIIKIKESPYEYKQRLKTKISNNIDMVGINHKSIGYKYLVSAIFLSIEKYDKNIYDYIGKEFKRTPASIERSMQYAIDSAWKTTNVSDLINNYTAIIHSDRGVPTVTEFIFFYANKIALEL